MNHHDARITRETLATVAAVLLWLALAGLSLARGGPRSFVCYLFGTAMVVAAALVFWNAERDEGRLGR